MSIKNNKKFDKAVVKLRVRVREATSVFLQNKYEEVLFTY